MCGIVGVLGNHEVAPILVEALKRLEYRGYDSAGIATVQDGVLDRRRADDWQVRVGFRFPDAAFVAALSGGEMPVVRAEPENSDVIFTSPDGPSLAALFYGGLAAEEADVTIAGDADAATRFMALFELPAKIA